MEFFQNMHESATVYRLGWALLHTIWIGAAIAALLATGLWTLRRRSANARYLAACAGLVLLVAAPIAVYLAVSAPSQPLAASQHISASPSADSPNVFTLPTPPSAFRTAPLDSSPGNVDQPPVAKSAPRKLAPAAADAPPLLTRLSRAIEPAMPWIVLAWLAGVAAMSIWQVSGYLAASRLRRLGTRPAGECLIQSVVQLARAMRVSRAVKVLESMLVKVPTVVGWLKPVLLLPAGLATGLTPRQVNAIPAHELAHIRRYDYLVNLLQSLAEAVLFYHPAVWFISRRIRLERENCCDDLALACGRLEREGGREGETPELSASGSAAGLTPEQALAQRVSYAESLLSLAERAENAPAKPRPAAAALGATGRPSHLRRRIARLLGRSIEERSHLLRTWPLTALFLLATLLAVGQWSSCTGQAGGAGASARQGPTTQPTTREHLAATSTGGRLASSSGGNASATKPMPTTYPVTISKETTRITQPLKADGTPDYLAAVNQAAAVGVTKDNNAAVLVFQAVGPYWLSPDQIEHVLPQLGVVVPAGGRSFKNFATQPMQDPEYSRAFKASWKPQELPAIDAWLNENKLPLDQIVEASKREKYYVPLYSSQSPPMVTAAIPSYGGLRPACDALIVRANRSAGMGNMKQASEDVLAVYRMGMLVGQGSTLVDRLIGMALVNRSCEAVSRLACEGRMSSAEAAMVSQWLRSNAAIQVQPAVDRFERFAMLDAMIHFSGMPETGWVGDPGQEWSKIPSFTEPPLTLALAQTMADVAKTADWDLILRLVNELVDEQVKAMNAPDHAARVKALAAVDARFREAAKAASEAPEASADRSARSRWLGYKLLGLWMSRSFGGEETNAGACATERNLALAALAINQFKASTGQYPEKLEQLLPNYLRGMPQDVLGDRPLTYHRTDKGYILYSVGKNMRDDGGKTREEDKACDDLVVRCPSMSASRPATQPASREALVTRVYDIRDLIVEIPDSSPPPIWSAVTASATTKPADEKARERAEQRTNLVMKAIRESVDAQSWNLPGTGTRVLNGNVIITQTAGNHEAIMQLLATMREARSVQVNVETRLLWPGKQMDGEIRSLMRKSSRRVLEAGGAEAILLGEPEVEAILDKVKKAQDARLLQSPRITLYDNHKAYVSIAQQAVVSLPILQGSGGSVAMAFQDGARISVQPVVTPDRRNVTLTLDVSSAKLDSSGPEPVTSIGEVSGNVLLADGEWLLARMSVEQSKVTGVKEKAAGTKDYEVIQSPSTPTGESVYVLVKPTIIIQKEYEEQAFNAATTQPAATQPATSQDARLAEQAKKQQVAALKGRVNALIKEQKYKEAVDVLEEIRRLDPKDQEAARRLEEYKTFVKLLEDDQSYGWPDFYLRPNVVPWYKLVHPLHRSSTATQPANE